MIRELSRWSFLLVLLVSGCAPETRGVRRWVELELVLGPDGTRIVSSSRTSRTNPPVEGPTLSWALIDEHREVIAEGRVADTREVRFEDLRGAEENDEIASEVGVLTVRVPQESGTLVLRDPTGLVVGRVVVTSGDQRVSSLALLSRGDVLGDAVQIRGGSEGLSILFLPEGYTEAELERFHGDVDRVVDALGAQPDYALFWDRVRVLRRDVRSRVSGAGTDGVAIDTAFDIAYGHAGTERCAWFATAEGRAAVERLRTSSHADAVAILVNSSAYGGCGQGGIAVGGLTSHGETALVVAHELGHALFGLADEYETPNPAIDDCVGGLARSEVNVSDSPTDLPWADLVDASGTVGAFEGAHYCSHGRYRPTHDCLMRHLGARMCPVCLRQMARVFGVPVPASTGTGAHTGGGGASGGSGGSWSVPTIEIVNLTGAELWARCDGTESSACTGWVALGPGESNRLASFDRRVVLDNQDALAGVPIRHRFTASRDRVEVYANAEDPLVPPSGTGAGTGTGTGAGTGTRPSDITASTPTIRSASIAGDAIEVSWDRVAGGPDYWVYALAMTSSTDYAGYTVETVADAGERTTLTRTLGLAALCAEAGPGDYGLVVQVMLAGESETAQSEWVSSLGGFSCP